MTRKRKAQEYEDDLDELLRNMNLNGRKSRKSSGSENRENVLNLMINRALAEGNREDALTALRLQATSRRLRDVYALNTRHHEKDKMLQMGKIHRKREQPRSRPKTKSSSSVSNSGKRCKSKSPTRKRKSDKSPSYDKEYKINLENLRI